MAKEQGLPLYAQCVLGCIVVLGPVVWVVANGVIGILRRGRLKLVPRVSGTAVGEGAWGSWADVPRQGNYPHLCQIKIPRCVIFWKSYELSGGDSRVLSSYGQGIMPASRL